MNTHHHQQNDSRMAAIARRHRVCAKQEAQAECDLIGSGPRGGVYELLVRDMQKLCGETLSICATPEGSGKSDRL